MVYINRYKFKTQIYFIMDYQICPERYYMSRSMYSVSSSSYYNYNRFPAKMSLQHFLPIKKPKSRAEQTKKANTQAKQFDIQKVKQKIYQAQKSQYKFYTKSSQKQMKFLNKRIKSIREVEQIPQLNIQREPIRFHTQCTKPIFKQQETNSIMYIRRKKSANKNLIKVVSKSLQISKFQQKFETYNLTQIDHSLEGKLNKKKQKNRIKNRSKQSFKLKQNAKQKESQRKRTFISEDNIQGWQIKNQAKDQLSSFI